MRHERVTEQIRETASLYALGALSQSEARAFEDHLNRGCPVCASQLRRFESVVSGIGFAAPEVQPPAELREVLFSRLEQEVCAKQHEPELVHAPPPLSSLLQTPPSRARSYVPWVIALALVAAVALSAYYHRQAEDALVQERTAMAAAWKDVQQTRASLKQEEIKAQKLEEMNAALRSPEVRVIFLAGQANAPGAAAVVFWNMQNGRCVLNAFLPAAPAGRVYQLWFVTPTQKRSVGLIETDPDGRGFATFAVSGDVAIPNSVAITLEPEGGSTQPTMPVIASGKIS